VPVVMMVVVVMAMMVVAAMMVVPMAPVAMVQLVADLADDVERPFVAVAAASDHGIDEEIGADADRHRPAVRLGLG
jgi:hypothetical protein